MCDLASLSCDDLDLPDGYLLMGDKVYNNYKVEDMLHDVGVELLPIRKNNALRPVQPFFGSNLGKSLNRTISQFILKKTLMYRFAQRECHCAICWEI